MPIRPFLNGGRFDPEMTRVLGVAFEMCCIALRTGDCDDFVKQSIAMKIIGLAKAGERNPDLLCERALRDIRGPQVTIPAVHGICCRAGINPADRTRRARTEAHQSTAGSPSR
jgi:hypothetical protein